MSKKPIFAIFVLLMLALMMFPAMPVSAWEYQDGTPSDTLFEKFGPRADKMLIKLYSTAEAEWDALARGEIDITDWALSAPYKTLFESTEINPATGLPYRDTINVIFYGDEFGLFILDINNNNNEYLGNPPNPLYPNPRYPNPTSVVELRQAIAHLADRGQLDTIVGAGFYSPLYTPVPPSMGAYSHPQIKPGGALEYLTYPYSRAAAEAKLDAGGFPIGASGWRYWDRNKNGVQDPGEDELFLKFFIRADHAHRRDMGNFIAAELEAVKVKVDEVYGTISAARIQVMANKDFHMYTGGWSLGVDPDHLILWNWDFYWHPGRPYNYAGCNDPLFNEYSYGVMYANTFDEARINAWLAQEVYAEKVLSVPLWSYAGSKAMSRFYTGGNTWQPVTPDDGENAYRGQYWEGAVSVPGYGVDSGFGFMNMHPRGFARGTGNMTIRYAFKTTDLRSFNPVYAEWLWDWNVLGLQFDSLLARNPYNLAEFMPWLAEAYEVGTYAHPVYGTCTKIRFTLRSEATWADGMPITVADVYFTFVELDDILAARGLPPPWWISNVLNILSFSILDPYNFEVLLDVKTVFAIGWIGGNIILPKHIWKPLAETGPVEDIAADPNQIGSGPWRFKEYVAYSHVLMVANEPGSTVQTSHVGSVPVTSPYGYWRYHPPLAEGKINDARLSKVLCDPETKKALVASELIIHNTYLSGPITIDLYTDEGLEASDVVIPPGGNATYNYPAVEFNAARYSMGIFVNIKSPPELAGWYNTTVPLIMWVTIKEDIAGRTFYDDIGLPAYPYKTQLPSPDIKVDIKDVAIAAKAFGSYPGHERWNTVADINADYKIDIKDIAAIAKKFGWVGA